jgi:hypothetical protein
VAAEEPQVRADIEFGADEALAVRAAVVADVGDAVEHQQAGIALTEQFAARTGQQLLTIEGGKTRHCRALDD